MRSTVNLLLILTFLIIPCVVLGEEYTDAINLDGQAFIRLDLQKRPVSSFQDVFKFRFRTNHANGHILYSQGTQKDILSLRLQNNKLILGLDLGGEGDVTEIEAGSLLDDNLWHEVFINRTLKHVHFTVDKIVVKQRLSGDFMRLDLNHDLFIGGIPVSMQNEVSINHNFTGCIENLMLNNTNVIQELKTDKKEWLYQRHGDILFTCRFEEIIPVTLTTEASHIKVDGFYNPFMNCSFDFRTFNEDGLLMYNKFSSANGFVKVSVEKGKLIVQVQGTDTPVVNLDPFPEKKVNDGLWHPTRVVLKTDMIIIELDDKPSYTTRKFSMTTGQTYLIGGGVHGYIGFVGCLRNLYVEGRYIHVKSLPETQVIKTRPGDILFDSCQMIDRCHPNPCEHGAVCRQNHLDFTCDCGQTGYAGAVCHSSKNPLSCDAYRIEFPKTKKAEINIDVDGSGPLDSFPVTCLFLSDDRTQTILHHSSEGATTVRGYQEPGSYIRDIKYDANFEQIVILVNRSYTCKQQLRYECHNARLLNTPYSGSSGVTLLQSDFKPFSWWVSRNNKQMDYWGGSLPGSRRCACGLYGSCRDSRKWCNCDSFGGALSDSVFVDEGEIVEKDFLPVRQLRFGDTGSSPTTNKWGRYTLGPLVCEGDTMFDHAITFRYEDATIDLAPFDLGYSADIYLQFKTTAETGVLLHSTGPEDFIKLSITSGKTIQFSFAVGSGPRSVTIESSYRLNDDHWHSVLIEWNKKEARLIVDGKLTSDIKTASTGPIIPLNLTSDLVVGATVEYREGYVGCIRSLLFNGVFIDLHAVAKSGLYGVTTGCQGKCQSNPCLNNGTCYERYSSYTCDCQWTGFKGPICADEIGVNLQSDNYIRYDFETSISTLEEDIRVGFTTTEHRGLILGVSSYSGEYLSLVMSTSGHLRLVFDFGFERQELIIRNENFALGQHHDIRIKRSDRGTKITIFVDNNEPIVHTFKIRMKADSQFNSLKSIYVGRNETMDSGEGFVGCISRVSFDDHFPLRRLFQENRRSNVRAFPSDDSVREDTCGIESVTHPPETIESRPPPNTFWRGDGDDSRTSTASIIFGIVIGFILIVFIALYASGKLYFLTQKGDYVTREDLGAKDALDPDTAVLKSKTGPDVTKEKEYFI